MKGALWRRPRAWSTLIFCALLLAAQSIYAQVPGTLFQEGLLVDNNQVPIDGPVDLSDRTDQVQRFKSAGWHVQEIDGHDPEAIDAAIIAAKASNKP